MLQILRSVFELQYSSNTAIKLFFCSNNSGIPIHRTDTWHRTGDSGTCVIWRLKRRRLDATIITET